MKEYVLFSGCMISTRLPYLESASMKVLKRLGTELKILDDQICCPEPVSMQTVNSKTWYAMAARNISLAERENADMITLCSGCNSTLFRVNRELKKNEELKGEINNHLEKIGKRFRGSIEIKSLLRVMYEDIGLERLKECVRKPLDKVNVAVHLGCHSMDEIGEFDDSRDPKSLKILLSSLGARVISYSTETLCCGGFVLSSDRKASLACVEEKTSELINLGADCLVVICPNCLIQYDIGQTLLKQKFKSRLGIPVIYLSQFVGLSMGFGIKEMGLNQHKIRTRRFFEKLGISNSSNETGA